MTERNKQLASIFHDLSAIYRFSNDRDRFRAIAYERAEKVIRDLPEDITIYLAQETLDELPYIGKSLQEDIREFCQTGKVTRHAKLKKRVPYELLELMDIEGFGPQTLKTLHTKLGLRTKDDVMRALEEGMVSELKGFGPKKVENMLRSLQLHEKAEGRMVLWDALQAGEKLVSLFQNQPGVIHVELAGSLRRRKESIGDIDMLIAAKHSDWARLVDLFTNPNLARRVLAKGDTKASIILKENGRQADLRIVQEHAWGAALQYFTGSKDHNVHLRTLAKDKGYKISEYGIFHSGNGKRVAGKSEEEIYHTLGMQFIPPEMREDKGEIDLALKHEIPELVTLNDIKGDLHMHSMWSDGLQKLEDIAHYVLQHFRYEYVVITDHSKSSRIAGGLDEDEFLQQIQVIRETNEKLGTNLLKCGAEVDILPNGTLDLSDEILAQLDWVTASVHAGVTRDNTDRLIKACENPNVHCISHPTGRLIGKRDPYPVDMSHLVEVARETGTALEINAQADRMDLNDEMAAMARAAGVKLVINTDSHRPSNFHFMTLGVAIARRAWCRPNDILNTRSWKEVKQWLKKPAGVG